MSLIKLIIIKLLILINILVNQVAFADNHNIYETLELIQKNIKTLEKAIKGGPAGTEILLGKK